MSDVQAVEAIIVLKKKSGSNPWPVVEKCIEIWEKKRPLEWKSFLVEIDLVKKTRRNKHASSESKGGRYLLDIPTNLMYMIRKAYSAEELPMNREFMREFARRYSRFAIPQNL